MTDEPQNFYDLNSNMIVLRSGVTDGGEYTFSLETRNANTRILSVHSEDAEITDNGDGTYSFTMPRKDMIITVEAEEVANNIKARRNGDGSVRLTMVDEPQNFYDLNSNTTLVRSKVIDGGEYTFKLEEAADTRLVSVTADGAQITDNGDGTYSFTMPRNEVTIIVTSEIAESDVRAKLVGTGEVWLRFTDNNYLSFNLSADEKTVRADAVAAGRYTFTLDPKDQTRILSVTAEGAQLTNEGNNTYSFTMPKEDVVIIVEAEYATYDILALKTGDGDAAVSYDGTLTELTGTAQTVAEGVDSGDYQLVIKPAQNSTIMSVSVDGTPVTPDSEEDGTYTVTVDDKDVTVTVDVRKNPTITVNRTGSGVVYTNSGTTDVSNTTYSVEIGSDHSFDFIPHEGESLISVTVKRGDGNAVTVYDAAGSSGGAGQSARNVALGSSEFACSLTDVDEDCVITARFTEPEQYKLYVIKQGTGKGSITCDSDKYTDSFTLTFDEGSEPKLAFAAADGSKLVFVKMGDSKESAAEVTLTDGALDVPAMSGDVYVIVEFEKTGPSGGDPGDGPKTGDSTESVIIAANLMLVSALAAYVSFVAIRKKQKKDAQ